MNIYFKFIIAILVVSLARLCQCLYGKMAGKEVSPICPLTKCGVKGTIAMVINLITLVFVISLPAKN